MTSLPNKQLGYSLGPTYKMQSERETDTKNRYRDIERETDR